MKLENLINGQRKDGETFSIKSEFYNYHLDLARYTNQDVEEVCTALNTCEIPPLRRRRELISLLKDFQVSGDTMRAICLMSGTPISLVQERIERGKEMLKTILSINGKEVSQRKTLFVAQPANDSQEPFFFIAHSLLAGTPMTIKVSRREPSLTMELAECLLEKGLPAGFLNIIHGDTTQKEDSLAIQRTLRLSHMPFVMGDGILNKKQYSFDGDYTKGLVLDADIVRIHLITSVEAPLSCLAEHNYLVVGEENFHSVVRDLKKAYSTLYGGSLLDVNTRRSSIDYMVRGQIADLLNQGRMHDTLRVLYPSHLIEGRITPETIEEGIIVEHYTEDLSLGVNPLMTKKLPAYITAVRCVSSLEQAVTILEESTKKEKIMALAIYGNPEDAQYPQNFDARLKNIAYEIHRNKSPQERRGIYHQGINIQEVLTQ